MKLLLHLPFVFLWGVAVGKVWFSLWSTEDKYEAGESAVLRCNISSNGNVFTRCEIFWAINQENITPDIKTLSKYKSRVQIDSQSASSTLTLNNLSTNDTDEILCMGSCIINRVLTAIPRAGISLTVIEKPPEPPHPWLKYLLFAINLLVFLTATIICAVIIRKRCQQRQSRTL